MGKRNDDLPVMLLVVLLDSALSFSSASLPNHALRPRPCAAAFALSFAAWSSGISITVMAGSFRFWAASYQRKGYADVCHVFQITAKQSRAAALRDVIASIRWRGADVPSWTGESTAGPSAAGPG